MTLPVQTPTETYVYQGPGEYEFSFYIDKNTSLVVKHYVPGESLIILQEGQDYTVDYTPYGPGKITTTYDPPVYGDLILERQVPIDQPTDWVNQGPLDMEQLEKDHDRIVMIIQQLQKTYEISGYTTWKGEWKPNYAYQARDTVTGPAGSPYEFTVWISVVDHVSDSDFELDLDRGYWHKAFDMTSLEELYQETVQARDEACTCRDEACICRDEACACRDDAQVSEDNARDYALAAGQDASLAGSHAVCAEQWASYPEDQPVPCGSGSEYSAYHWAMKAIQGGVTTITSSDEDICIVEQPDNKTRHLLFNTDQGSGLPKLDANGKIKIEQLPIMGLQLMGTFQGHDTCPKDYPSFPEETPCAEPDYRNPSEVWPSTTFVNGAYFIISTPDVNDPPGHVNVNNNDGSNPYVEVRAGDALIYADGSGSLAEGWYHVPEVVKGGTASSILFDDTGLTCISGSNVQVALESADACLSGKVSKSGDVMSGSLKIESSDPNLYFICTEASRVFDQVLIRNLDSGFFITSDIAGTYKHFLYAINSSEVTTNYKWHFPQRASGSSPVDGDDFVTRDFYFANLPDPIEPEDPDLSNYVPKTGGTFTGYVGFNGRAGGADPVNNSDYVTRSFYFANLPDPGEGGDGFPAGTRLIFFSDPPPGWVVDQWMNSTFMVVTKKTGTGTSGGKHSPLIMNVIPAHTHYIQAHNHRFVQEYENGPYHDYCVDITTNQQNCVIEDWQMEASGAGYTETNYDAENWEPHYIVGTICQKT